MPAAASANHMCRIVEPIGRALHEAGVISLGHEESGSAGEASRAEGVPASIAGLVAYRTIHGLVGIIVARVADAFLAGFESTMSCCLTKEALVVFGAIANCTREVAGSTLVVFTQRIMSIPAWAEDIADSSIVLGCIFDPQATSIAGLAHRCIKAGQAGQFALWA
jgi:hypothetical protein